MRKSGFHLILLASFLLGPLCVEKAQQPPLPYDYEIPIGDKKVGISKEKINNLKKRATAAVPKPSSTIVSRAKIESLAKEFRLTEETSLNPHLVFVNSDIAYWENRKLDETRLALEFAARRLILEEAERQGLRIASKEMLSKAAEQIIPLIKEQQSSLVQDIVCSGNTSEEYVKQSWDGLNSGNLEKALPCTEKTIKKWTHQADDQQAKATKQGCSEPPQASDLKTYFSSYWALSDVATSWFIRGEVFYKQGKWQEAREAYKTVIDRYQCAFTWDPRGWFWKTADGAQEKYDEVRLK